MLYMTAPQDTLAYQLKGSVLSASLDRTQASVYGTAQALSDSGCFGEYEHPDVQAAQFYLLNHVASHLSTIYSPLEPVSAEHLEWLLLYRIIGSSIARRLFWYVFVICTREARHNKTGTCPQSVIDTVREEYPDCSDTTIKEMYGYTGHFPDSDAALTKLLQEQTKYFQMGPFCKMLSALYYQCSWSSSFGGPKWGVIADALHSFVSGEWTAEIFADTAFTLAHNTAPIFNKGMLYYYPGSNFIEMLDVQRAGMIPIWLTQDEHGKQAATNLNSYWLPNLQKQFPEMFAEQLNWVQVEQLGAVHKYSHKPGYGQVTPKGKKVSKMIPVDYGLIVPAFEREDA